MEYEGDLSVLQAKGRTGLLILGGGTRGVIGCAQTVALHRRGWREKLTVMCGVSSGAGPVLYLAGNTGEHGASIYYEECTTREFLSFSPSRFLRGTTVDVGGFLGSVFRGSIGRKGVNLEAVRTCPADVVVGVTDFERKEGELLDLKTAAPDPVEAVVASMATARLYRRPVYVNGRRYHDGILGIQFPARELVEGWELDTLLILANRPRSWQHSFGRRVFDQLVGNKNPHTFEEGLDFLRQGKTPFLIVWTDESIRSPLEQTPQKLKDAAERSYKFMEELLARAGG